MFRYLALSWNTEDPEASHTASILCSRLRQKGDVWKCAMASEHVRVFCAEANEFAPEVVTLSNNAGTILGTVYSSRPSVIFNLGNRNASLDARCQADIVSSAGRSLVEEFWGSYVLILVDPDGPSVRVFRSPMSDLPCFYTLYRGVYVFCAFLEDCLDLGIGPFAPDMSCIRAIVVFGDPRTHETALSGVYSIDVGECVSMRCGRLTREWYWHPGRVAASEPIGDVMQARDALRAATRQCVYAMASRHDSIVLWLSGGIDSSIVASCLKTAHPRITCLNHYFARAVGDERRFARLVADQYDFELVEEPQTGDTDLRIMLERVARTPRPRVHFAGNNSYRSMVDLAETRGATALMSGSMGDCVFGRGASLLAAAEYVQCHGVRPHLFRVAYDIALRERLSIWRVLRSSLYTGLVNPPRGPWSHYEYEKSRSSVDSYLHGRMLTQEAIRQYELEFPRFVHPWLQQAEHLPIGKLVPIAILTQEMPYEMPFVGRTDPPIIRPLVGQPVVECSLRIESFLNVTGGWDRAIARLAFADVLPKEVVRRNTKGSPSETIREVIDRNAPLIREMLLDGILVKEGLLDPKQIEAALPAVATKVAATRIALMHHLYTETWLRHWKTSVQRQAA